MAGKATALCADRLFDGSTLHRDAGVAFQDGRIVAHFGRESAPAGVPLQYHPGLLAPGFVDLQVNGGDDVLFNDHPNVEAVRTIARAHQKHGTTSLLPTLISPRREVLREALRAISKSIDDPVAPPLRILGLHVEGPHLNPKRAGAHQRRDLRALEAQDLELLSGLGTGATLVTLAPECVPAGAVRTLRDAGVRVFAGHSEADAAAVARSLDEGLHGLTHLFNAMPPVGGRAPGIVGAAFASSSVFAGIIADGAHVNWTSFRAAFAALGPERLFFVSDAMPPVGAETAQPFSLGGAPIVTRGENDARHCVLPDGTLAGTCLTMAAALRNGHRYGGVELAAALRMATATPAAALGLNGEVGSLVVGAHADLVLLDDELRVRALWVRGEEVPVG